MYTHFRNTVRVVAAIICALAIMPGLYAQRTVVTSVNTVMLGPPYNGPFDQLKNKIRVTVLSNTSFGSVYMSMMIRGDNGIVIQSNGNSPDYFSITSGLPEILPNINNTFDILFQLPNLSLSNIDPGSLSDYGLPPGHYQVCFQVWNPSGGSGPVAISPAAPVGCTDFTIQQAGLNISTIIKPPYDGDFLSFYDKTIVNLSSTQLMNVFLRMTLTGNNGIIISTSPDYIPTELIQLEPNVPVMLTSQDLWTYFNPDNLIFSGILKQEVSDKGLPEGTYRLCFRAYTSDGVAVSGTDPAGCSAPFTLQLLEPPSIISPKCGTTLTQGATQPVLFSWTPSPGAPPGTPYTLRIVQMDDPSASPGDAILTATTPAFFETTVLNTSFLYGPGQPVLEEGKQYAFEVIAGTEALNISNPFDFDAAKLRFKNKGRSTPCYFKYEGTGLIGFIAKVNPSGGPKYSQISPDSKILPYSVISGQLNYKFKQFRLSLLNTANSTGSGSQPPSNQQSSSAGSGQMGYQSSSNFSVSSANSATETSKLSTNLGYIDPSGSKPLGNIRISLVVRYVMKSGSINGKDEESEVISKKNLPHPSNSDFTNEFPDDGTVLKTTYTASDGSFSFNFVNTDTTLGKIK